MSDLESRPTKHIAALCPACDCAFVALTLKPGGSDIEAVAARLKRMTCPNCGNTEHLKWLVGPRHAEAVARLRAEAALD